MTAHRLYSWRWYPHDWLRFALPWRIKQNSARVLDAVKPDVVHFQSHIIVGRGLVGRGPEARHPHHRHQPLHAREHARVHPAAQGVAGVGDRTRLEGRPPHVRPRRGGDDADPQGRASSSRSTTEHRTTCIAISCGIDAHNYTPDCDAAHREPHPLRRPGHRREADRRAAAGAHPARPGRARREARDRRRRRPEAQPRAPRRPSSASPTASPSRATSTDERAARGLLTRASVFAMPSIAELQSIATMEAMASGLPIVAANAMALPHLVHDGENGYLFEPGNVDDLAAKLQQVLEASPEEYRALKERLDPAHRRARHPAHALDLREPVPWQEGHRPRHGCRAGDAARVNGA